MSSAQVVQLPGTGFFTDKGTLVVPQLAEVIQDAGHLRTGVDGRLYRYHHGVYRPDGDIWARARVRELLGDRCQRKYFDEVLTWLRSFESTVTDQPRTAVINVANGTGVVLWSWATGYLGRERLPKRRVLIRFDYPTYSKTGSRAGGWLLIEHGDAEICEKYPGGEEDLVVVVHEPLAFARWHLGELSWGDALRSGAIEVHGDPTLARALPTWNRCVGPPPRPAAGAVAAASEHHQLDATAATARRAADTRAV